MPPAPLKKAYLMQPHALFAGQRVLVVEDEFIIAEDMKLELEQRGAEVIGPVPNTALALRELWTKPRIDCAVLDVKLGDSLGFEVADELIARRIPFIFSTAYGDDGIPARYRHILKCEKPLPMALIMDALGRTLVQARRAGH